MNYLEYFKETWIPILKKQYQNASNYEAKKEIKNNFYKNTHLNNRQKDILWKQIVG